MTTHKQTGMNRRMGRCCTSNSLPTDPSSTNFWLKPEHLGIATLPQGGLHVRALEGGDGVVVEEERVVRFHVARRGQEAEVRRPGRQIGLRYNERRTDT